MLSFTDKLRGSMYGHAIGDALGVPVEFKSRTFLKEFPAKDYLGFMCWNQPPGTFSDDSSMMFCTVESFLQDYSPEKLGALFINWYKEGYWGAHDALFDIGGTTRRSLDRIMKGESALFSGEFDTESNGNGSLMRILPLCFVLRKESNIAKRFRLVKEVSSITHAHFRSVFACFLFVELGILLLTTDNLTKAYTKMQENVNGFALREGFHEAEVNLFKRLLKGNICELTVNEISSTGYVLDALESALYALFTTDSFEASVLKAVNLGGDTDSTAAINGGLAGMHYGANSIRKDWIERLVKTQEIGRLVSQFETVLLPGN